MAKKETAKGTNGPSIEKKQAVKFFDDLLTAENKGVKARSALGDLHKKGKADYGLHSQAVKHVRRLKRMSPEERADWWRTEKLLIELLELDVNEDLFE